MIVHSLLAPPGQQLNDLKYSKLLFDLGLTSGQINDLWYAWLLDIILTSEPAYPGPFQVMDLEKKFLDIQTTPVIPPGNLNDRWFDWLGAQGHMGTLNDRWYAFWAS